MLNAAATSSCQPVILKDKDVISCKFDLQLGGQIVSLTRNDALLNTGSQDLQVRHGAEVRVVFYDDRKQTPRSRWCFSVHYICFLGVMVTAKPRAGVEVDLDRYKITERCHSIQLIQSIYTGETNSSCFPFFWQPFLGFCWHFFCWRVQWEWSLYQMKVWNGLKSQIKYY